MTLEEFNNELLAIGGRHPNGMPRLRCVSAATELKFACGGLKIKYPRASRTDERWLWGLRDTTTGITTAKSEADVIANTDESKYAVRKFLGRTVTWIGRPNFVIEVYSSVDELKETPVSWFTHRYDWWKNPETKLMEWTDINGEYPANGRYDFFMAVKYDDGTTWGKFRELDRDVLAEVKRAVQNHENFREIFTDDQKIQQMVEAQEAKEDRFEAEMADQIEQEIGSDWRRAIKDNPRLFVTNPKVSNKVTKHGRAT